MDLTIREATTEDAALVAEMSRSTFYETFAEHNSEEDMRMFLEQQFTKEALMKEVGAAGNVFFLAYAGEEPAGYVRLREASPDKDVHQLPSIEIARIYVLKKFISYGIGRALMAHCIQYAQEHGKKSIWLGVWEKNER